MDYPKISTEPVAHSSNVAALGYDAATKTLQVDFKGGRKYHYQNVPAELFAGLLQSDSKGKYLNAQIRPNYLCVPLPEEN